MSISYIVLIRLVWVGSYLVYDDKDKELASVALWDDYLCYCQGMTREHIHRRLPITSMQALSITKTLQHVVHSCREVHKNCMRRQLLLLINNFVIVNGAIRHLCVSGRRAYVAANFRVVTTLIRGKYNCDISVGNGSSNHIPVPWVLWKMLRAG